MWLAMDMRDNHVIGTYISCKGQAQDVSVDMDIE